MLRLLEICLFLAPFAAFLAWRRVSAGAGPSPAALAVVLAGLALFGGALVWFGVHRRLDPGAHYVPAHLEDGRVVPGHSG